MLRGARRREKEAEEASREVRQHRVIEVLARLGRIHGAPAFMRSDNGPEPDNAGRGDRLLDRAFTRIDHPSVHQPQHTTTPRCSGRQSASGVDRLGPRLGALTPNTPRASSALVGVSTEAGHDHTRRPIARGCGVEHRNVSGPWGRAASSGVAALRSGRPPPGKRLGCRSAEVVSCRLPFRARPLSPDRACSVTCQPNQVRGSGSRSRAMREADEPRSRTMSRVDQARALVP